MGEALGRLAVNCGAGPTGGGKPARWTIHWAEVAVFDANAAALGIDDRELMAAVGAALAGQAIHMIRSEADGMLSDRPVWILCGPGNNGGDGFACALGLAEEGIEVMIQSSHAVQKSVTAQHFRDRCRRFGVVEEMWPLTIDGLRPCLIIDCLLGAGAGVGAGVSSRFKNSTQTPRSPLFRPLRGAVAGVVDWVREIAPRAPILACDAPTGLSTEGVLAAAATVTFHFEKMGLRVFDGLAFAGQTAAAVNSGQTAAGVGDLHIAPLPWPKEVFDCGPGDVLRYPPLDSEARKGDRGRLLIVGGGPYHGAPLLAGAAAARVGCDLVHVAMPNSASQRAKWPEGLIPEQLPDESHLTLASIEVLEARLTKGRGCQALLIGPGLGRDEATISAVQELLRRAARLQIPTLIDADAIAALPAGAWPAGLIGVATPHGREALEWLGDVSPSAVLSNLRHLVTLGEGSEAGVGAELNEAGVGGELSEAGVGAELSEAGVRIELSEAGLAEEVCESATIVITGPIDELYGYGGRRANATGGHPRMAVGGTGDLLAGTIAGLLAQSMAPWPAARLGCALLRKAGKGAATIFGPGLVASDVPPHIAEALNEWLPK
jgi:NAD(P)H-hydrate epimerase